jgi:U3 small nucleolar RNA-associated protein 20
LKKKLYDSRESARKCLAQIAMITGPVMVHVIFREMAFNLRQNFEKHILNYSIHYILEKAILEQPLKE